MEENYVSITKVCLLLDTSPITVRRWYQWYESERYDVPEGIKLPPYFIRDKRKTKFWKIEDVPKLRKFQKQLQTTHYGAMAQYHADMTWGRRGKNLNEKRKPGEYTPRKQYDPKDVSSILDRKDNKKWEKEQLEELENRRKAKLNP